VDRSHDRDHVLSVDLAMRWVEALPQHPDSPLRHVFQSKPVPRGRAAEERCVVDSTAPDDRPTNQEAGP